ncbi:MAG: hypothetical protein JWQ09_5705, partial [Segetibacter sp.]|nr:hypothetical protein [Segetibacter sp.]MCW3111199.1 hypothetical protein [Segetibacter sp.]
GSIKMSDTASAAEDGTQEIATYELIRIT